MRHHSSNQSILDSSVDVQEDISSSPVTDIDLPESARGTRAGVQTEVEPRRRIPILKTMAECIWSGFQFVNQKIADSPSFKPTWAHAPLLKSYERTKPILGYPRETDSLCPECVKEVRAEILDGKLDIQTLVEGNPGEIKAELKEKDGHIVIQKSCPIHGDFEDVLSIDSAFTHLIESRFPGRDFKTSGDELVHRHGTSSIQYGRGAVLTIDLTNRCNMMCNPCFMDANQVGYVHELTMEDVKKILDASISFKPKRQMSVQFSGGEPTISPIFFDACRYAKEVGYWCVQAATNGLQFALDPNFAHEAKEAGLDMVYLQFDGVTNESNQHRHISNLFDAKRRSIENLAKAGIDITLVTTVVNTINQDQVGPILQFCIDNSDKIGSVSFQPVSFTGRDEDISDEQRHRQRYTISHLAQGLRKWSNNKIDVYRDWYPLGAGTLFTTLADHLRGPDVEFGGQTCSCHPNCGCCIHLVVNSRTKAWAPLTEFFDLDQFMKDVEVITDAARGPKWTKFQTALSVVRNFDPNKTPKDFGLNDLKRILQRRMGGSFTAGVRPKDQDWKIMWVGGMWFQDLWTYDFRRTEMCVIPYGTQEGEVSFCAYNTGVGWRQIIENMYMTATTAQWFKEKGRHKIYAGNRPITLPEKQESRDPLELPLIGDHSCQTDTCGCSSNSLREKIKDIVQMSD